MEAKSMRNDVLASVYLDIEEVMDELRAYWIENKEYNYNPSALTKFKHSGDNLMCCCPFHVESTPSFGILKSYPYTWFCFACEKGGNLPQLVAHVVGLNTEVHGEHFIMKNFVTLSTNQRPPLDLEKILDKGERDRRMSLLDSEVDKYKNKRHPYLYQRGFSERTLQRYEIGYDETLRAMTIPVRDIKGHVRFIKRRFVDQKKFLNQENIDKKDIVYGLYYITQATKPITEICLTESETDTIACYQAKIPAGAILGRVLFKDQILALQKAGIKVVNLFFDNDKWGVKATLQAYESIVNTSPIRVNVIQYPCAMYGIDTLNEDEIPYKDANALLLANLLQNIKKMPFEEYVSKLKM